MSFLRCGRRSSGQNGQGDKSGDLAAERHRADDLQLRLDQIDIDLKQALTDNSRITDENDGLQEQVREGLAERQRLSDDKDQAMRALRLEVSKMRLALESTGHSAMVQHDPLADIHDEEFDDDERTAEEVEKMRASGLRHAVVNDGAESFRGVTPAATKLIKVDKDIKTRQILMTALRTNGMLGRLENARLQEMVDYMERSPMKKGEKILSEGSEGEYFYVIEDGEVSVFRNHKPVGVIHKGHAFGEVTLFFSVVRQADVFAKMDCVLWRLGRHTYNLIMNEFGRKRLLEVEAFLRQVKAFRKLDQRRLARLANGVQTEYYERGEVIVRHGETSDDFYIIDVGEVEMSKGIEPTSESVGSATTERRILRKGEYFGETQWKSGVEAKAQFTARARTDVQLLTLDRQHVEKLVGRIEGVSGLAPMTGPAAPVVSADLRAKSDLDKRVEAFRAIKLADLTSISAIGKGSFGVVFLVSNDTTRFGRTFFALKCMAKAWIRKYNAIEHVMAEKKAWLTLSGSSFLCQLYATLKDTRYLYYLMESLPGGDLYTHITKRGHFNDSETRFYSACIALGLEFMHERNIIFRDLKPENVALDHIGYGKLIDFGFAKDISQTFRTFTFCGSPYYMAPEVVNSEGHDYACDIWSFGVTLVEINTGLVPFRVVQNEHVLFKKISRGFDGFDLPRNLHHRVRDLVRVLCERRPADRLGYDDGGIRDLKQHRFFQDFDWPALQERKLKAPYKPEVSGPDDTKYARKPRKEIKDPPEDSGDWDSNF